jgi:hypothetical protein
LSNTSDPDKPYLRGGATGRGRWKRMAREGGGGKEVGKREEEEHVSYIR